MSTSRLGASLGASGDWLRTVVWAVAGATYLGALTDMVLVEHYEEWRQWIAVVAAAAGLASVAWAWTTPTARSLKTVHVVSAGIAAISVLGIAFHLWGNVQFSIEVAPDETLRERLWDTLSGGNPALAPGMMAVAAVLGWAAAWDHPARR